MAGHAALASARVTLASAQARPTERAGTGPAALLEQAVERFSRARLPYETARARLALAEALSRWHPEVAVAEAQGACETFERLGARPDADVAAALLRSLGAPARTGPKGVGVLTEREPEILRLLGEGLSNPEIATRLYISRKTASHHVSRVLAKLGLRNRAEAAAYATRAAAERGENHVRLDPPAAHRLPGHADFRAAELPRFRGHTDTRRPPQVHLPGVALYSKLNGVEPRTPLSHRVWRPQPVR